MIGENTAKAILRENLKKTSNTTIRLVLRPYTQLQIAICTSASQKSFTEISSGAKPTIRRSLPIGLQRTLSVAFTFIFQQINCEQHSFTSLYIIYFHYFSEIFNFSKYLMNSLVRVSRRERIQPLALTLREDNENNVNTL